MKDTVMNLENRDVECPASEIVNSDFCMILGPVEAESKRRRCGFVYNALNCEAGETACALGRLALRIVEVSGNRDDCPGPLPPRLSALLG